MQQKTAESVPSRETGRRRKDENERNSLLVMTVSQVVVVMDMQVCEPDGNDSSNEPLITRGMQGAGIGCDLG
jgi:hypothetical protein